MEKINYGRKKSTRRKQIERFDLNQSKMTRRDFLKSVFKFFVACSSMPLFFGGRTFAEPTTESEENFKDFVVLKDSNLASMLDDSHVAVSINAPTKESLQTRFQISEERSLLD